MASRTTDCFSLIAPETDWSWDFPDRLLAFDSSEWMLIRVRGWERLVCLPSLMVPSLSINAFTLGG